MANIENYVAEILKAFGMETSKFVSTPATTSKECGIEDPSIDQTNYQKLFGALLFLASRTRPDISFAV